MFLQMVYLAQIRRKSLWLWNEWDRQVCKLLLVRVWYSSWSVSHAFCGRSHHNPQSLRSRFCESDFPSVCNSYQGRKREDKKCFTVSFTCRSLIPAIFLLRPYNKVTESLCIGRSPSRTAGIQGEYSKDHVFTDESHRKLCCIIIYQIKYFHASFN